MSAQREFAEDAVAIAFVVLVILAALWMQGARVVDAWEGAAPAVAPMEERLEALRERSQREWVYVEP